MALATQCPHCHTTFRVANDQLKLHAGIVRCGSCQQIFNGIEHLVAPDAPPAAIPAQPAAGEHTKHIEHIEESVPAVLEPAASAAVAEDLAQAPATPPDYALDFDLGINDAIPAAAHEPVHHAGDDRREPGFHAPELREPSGNTTTADTEQQQRLALLAQADADWSVSDESSAVDSKKQAQEALLAMDTKVFLPAAEAKLAHESLLESAPAPASAAEPDSVPGFEPEFAPEFLSEFEAVFESELHADAAQDNGTVSLTEPEPEAEIEAEAEAEMEAGIEPEDEPAPAADEEPLLATALADNDHVDEVLEAEALDTEQLLEAVSIHPELIEEQISSISESEAPDFVVQAERKLARSKTLRITMAILSVVLFLTLLAQAAYTMRNQLAAWFPQAKPALADACKLLNCQISLLTQIDSVSIESNELQALAPNKNVFSLTLLLRNKGSTVQAWPMLELTLDNDKDQPVLRRVFTPAEYLANKADLVKGFPGASEQPVKLYFELETLKAAGYHVWLFYP
ncbi:MAG: DUF3426 domain-containing protein [Pseudomonadota bacterium]